MTDRMVCYRVSRIVIEATQAGPISLGGTLTVFLGRGFQEDDGSFVELEHDVVYTFTQEDFATYMAAATTGAARGDEMMTAIREILEAAGQLSDGALL